ncbi:pantothenate kinase [Pseudochryseolinea flava]|uniref:Type III pantothenate kinase n=2 Tax=Pseudochryseolinea flava TaxID=2059302 RepID=A0A364Y9N2_9BACT|nr:pantothenate kinase [Pseudochryseolinea flava]
MNVVVDYGNTSAKVGIFKERRLVDKIVFDSAEKLRGFLENYSGDYIIVSSVSVDATVVMDWARHFKAKFILTPSLPLPVVNRYATPQTLGVDRIAAACGAYELFPNQHCLAIDAGTCITYEFLDAGGNYLGGGISPGLRMRFEAMHTFTARLPLIQPVDQPALIGTSTEQCMQSGVIYGLCDEIEGIILRYHEKFGDLKVILCGGDARFFENKLKAAIFAVPELVLSGLNSILIYNVNR